MIPTVKRIVCLANSRMPGGTCIAGKQILDDGRINGWIRPVGELKGEGLPLWVQQFHDGSGPQLLDVIDVPVLRAMPAEHQQENWLVDYYRRWTRVRKAPRMILSALVDQCDRLWINGESTQSGLNDRVSVEMARTIKDSLRLVSVDKLDLKVWQPGKDFGNETRRVYGRFWVSGTEHQLSITDPVIEQEYLAQPDGYYSIRKCYLTVSLGRPWNDNVYKLIAAVHRD